MKKLAASCLLTTIICALAIGCAASLTEEEVRRIVIEESVVAPPGPQGVQGIRGERGDQGVKGAAGIRGIEGKQGPRGEMGSIGPVGPPGAQGPQGEGGEQGPRGQKGEQGEKGSAGPAGARGVTGRAAVAPTPVIMPTLAPTTALAPTPVALATITLRGSGSGTRTIDLAEGTYIASSAVGDNEDCSFGSCTTAYFGVEVESFNGDGWELLANEISYTWWGDVLFRVGDGFLQLSPGRQLVTVDAKGDWSITILRQ